MKNVLFAVACGFAVIAVGCADASAEKTPEVTQTTTDGLSAEASQSLAEVRAATAKYHNVDVALADGYVATDVCFLLEDGGMGYHYVNFDLLGQAPIANQPAILLYEDSESGGVRLTGVEYFSPVFVNGGVVLDPNTDPRHLGEISPAPTLFEHTFDGPMPGHFEGMPWHYDLHVWLWKDNPSGIFYHTNPRVTCP